MIFAIWSSPNHIPIKCRGIIKKPSHSRSIYFTCYMVSRPKINTMYHMHTFGASKCMHVVHSVGFRAAYLRRWTTTITTLPSHQLISVGMHKRLWGLWYVHEISNPRPIPKSINCGKMLLGSLFRTCCFLSYFLSFFWNLCWYVQGIIQTRSWVLGLSFHGDFSIHVNVELNKRCEEWNEKGIGRCTFASTFHCNK